MIFVMISALANFLMLVIYHGSFQERVSWTLLMATMGAVALARIAIEQSRAYSIGYAVALFAATFVVMSRFFGHPIFSAFILALIGYLADRIVHDCTIIDESQDSSGSGLIDSGRLFVKAQFAGDDDASKTKDESTPPTEAERPTRRGRKSNQPGRTVMYLALGALPLFGFGQFMMRSNQTAWSDAKWYLAVYLFSALSLLVTTSFLGLRRYLRQRDTEMPTNVTVGWLAGGFAMIAAVLMIAYAAPMPGKLISSIDTSGWFDPPNDQSASRYGWGDEGADTGPEDAAQTDKNPRETENENAGQQYKKGSEAGDVGQGNKEDGPTGNDKGGKKSASGDQNAKSQQGDESQQGDQSSQGDEQAQEDESDQSEPGEQSQQQESSKSDNDSKSDSQSEPDEESQRQPEQKQPNKSGDNNPKNQDRKQQEQGSKSNSNPPNEPRSSRPSPPSTPPLDIAGGLGSLFKFILIVALIGLIVFYLIRYHEHLRRWLEDLFGRKQSQDDSGQSEATESLDLDAPPRPFASFQDPTGSQTDSRRILVITFQAFDAWAREHGHPRRKDETPSEFLRRINTAMPEVAAAVAHVVDGYNRIVYGAGRATKSDLNAATQVWQIMTTAR